MFFCSEVGGVSGWRHSEENPESDLQTEKSALCFLSCSALWSIRVILSFINQWSKHWGASLESSSKLLLEDVDTLDPDVIVNEIHLLLFYFLVSLQEWTDFVILSQFVVHLLHTHNLTRWGWVVNSGYLFSEQSLTLNGIWQLLRLPD